MPLRSKAVCDVRADEPRPAGDQYPHEGDLRLVGSHGSRVVGVDHAIERELFAGQLGRGFDEVTEQGMRAVRSALQLGVKLATEHERMLGELCNLDQATVG